MIDPKDSPFILLYSLYR